MSIRSEIARFEREARQLETGPAQRKVVRNKVVGYADKFLDSLPTGKAYQVKSDRGAGVSVCRLHSSTGSYSLRGGAGDALPTGMLWITGMRASGMPRWATSFK